MAFGPALRAWPRPRFTPKVKVLLEFIAPSLPLSILPLSLAGDMWKTNEKSNGETMKSDEKQKEDNENPTEETLQNDPEIYPKTTPSWAQIGSQEGF